MGPAEARGGGRRHPGDRPADYGAPRTRPGGPGNRPKPRHFSRLSRFRVCLISGVERAHKPSPCLSPSRSAASTGRRRRRGGCRRRRSMAGWCSIPESPRNLALERARIAGGADARAAEDGGSDRRWPMTTRWRRWTRCARFPATARQGDARAHRRYPCRVRHARHQGVPVAEASDLAAAAEYEEVADMLMFDAGRRKAPSGPAAMARRSTGRFLNGRQFRKPWFLAGGLDPENVARAIELSGAKNGGRVVRRGKRARHQKDGRASPPSSTRPGSPFAKQSA